MNVTPDGGQNDPALGGAGAAGSGESGLDLVKGALSGAGGLQQLGQEQRAGFVFAAHGVQRRDQRIVHQRQRRLLLQQSAGRGGGFALQALLHRFHQGVIGAFLRRAEGLGIMQRTGQLCGGGDTVGVAGNIAGALGVPARENVVGADGGHDLLAGGIHNGQIQSRLHGQRQERGVKVGTAGQAEADVGNAQNGADAQLVLAQRQCPERLHHVLLLSAGGEGQAVNINVLSGNTGGQRRVPNAAGNGHPLLCSGGDARAVHGEADHRRAVLFAQGQDMLQNGGSAVDRVHDGLAVIGPQAPRQRLHIGGIQLQRLADHALHRLDHLLHHGRLVHIRRTHIDIQQLGAGLRLRHGLLHDVVHVALTQRLTETAFSSGVDPFAHHGNAVHGDAVHRGTEHRGHGMGRPAGNTAGEHILQQPDKVRSRAAAAAGGKQAQLPVGLHLFGIEPGRDVVAAAVGTGQTGVGFHEHREIARHRRGQPPGHRENLFGAKGAVDAHRIRAEPPGSGGKAFHRAAGEGAAVRLKAHAGQHRQGAVFFCRQQRSLQFVQVGEGFDHHQIGAGGHAGTDDPGVFADGVLKGQCADGLQQFPQRADVQRRQRTVGSAGALAAGYARRDDLLRRIGAARQFVGRRAKGIGIDDAAAGGGVHAVDGFDQLRIGDIEFLGPCAQLQTGGLKHGAHAAVQQEGMGLGKEFTDLHRFYLSFGIRSGHAAHSGRSLPDVLLPGGR